VLVSGEVIEASPRENPELFYGAIGGFGALGVIVEAELELADNTRLERRSVTMPLSEYSRFFRDNVRNSPHALFHNADISTIICGPGHIAQAHQPNEWVALDQLALCEAFMRRLADQVCISEP